MRILYVAQKYDYGDPARGLSFEHWNFHHSLVQLGHEVLYFDVGTLLLRHGREEMNRRLSETAQVEKPDVAFFVLTGEELDRATVRRISESSGAVTVNWFCDDHWRFENFSRHWAPSFHWVVTTAAGAVRKYRDAGYANVIKSQWACNHFLYRKLDLPLCYDVTFVGQPHGSRRAVIESLERQGVAVRTWGAGWEAGRLSQDEMIEVFNQSRINLNLSNSAVAGEKRGDRLRRAVRRSVGTLLPRGAVSRLKQVEALREAGRAPTERSLLATTAAHFDQIKGRNFEIPGCGGFLVTTPAEDLDSFFRPGEEIARPASVRDLARTIRHYLDNEDERSQIAEAGYRRTLAQHTYAHRFHDIFSRIGCPSPAASRPLGESFDIS